MDLKFHITWRSQMGPYKWIFVLLESFVVDMTCKRCILGTSVHKIGGQIHSRQQAIYSLFYVLVRVEHNVRVTNYNSYYI